VIVCPATLRLLLVSMMAVANEADFLRATLFLSLLGLSPVVSRIVGFGSSWEICCSEEVAALAKFPADDDPDVDALGLLLFHAFLAALPRTSPTNSAADFFLALSSSDERLDDMIVSRVP